MGILSSLFELNSKEEEKPAVVKVFTKSVVEPTIKESLANLAIEVIGAAKNTSLVPLDEDNLSSEYNRLVNLGLKNSAKIIKRQLDNINYHNKAIVKAEKLLKYMKVINELLGDSVILVSTSAFYELCHKYNLSIACPKSNLQEKTVIVSHAVDPIIFQYCPYGVLIYTMWGDEAEDKVFEEYKKLNNLV